MARPWLALVAVGLLFATTASAEGVGSQSAVPGSLGVPSAAGSSSGLFDRFLNHGNLHVSNTLVFSSGWGVGQGARSMNFTTLSYDFSGPLTASVTLGNRLFGAPRFPGDRGSMSLESLMINYKPNSNFNFTVDVVGRGQLYDRLLYNR
jgi:hypothetical protein